MKCPVCDAKVPESATFCQQCGAKLPQFGGEMDSPSGEPAEMPRAAVASPDSTTRDASTTSSRRRGTITDTLEETLWEGSYAPRAMLGTAVLCAVATIVLLVVALGYSTVVPSVIPLALILIIWALAAGRLATRRLGISYKLTNHMFYHRHGVLTRVTDRIELIEVHDVTYEQGLFERMVDVGSIKIASSDRTDPIFYLLGVQGVETVAQLIDKARRGEQVRRGRRIDFSHIDGET